MKKIVGGENHKKDGLHRADPGNRRCFRPSAPFYSRNVPQFSAQTVQKWTLLERSADGGVPIRRQNSLYKLKLSSVNGAHPAMTVELCHPMIIRVDLPNRRVRPFFATDSAVGSGTSPPKHILNTILGYGQHEVYVNMNRTIAIKYHL